MNQNVTPKISVVVPVYNEHEGLVSFHDSLVKILTHLDYDFEVIYCNDGSTDSTAQLIHKLHVQDKRVKLLSFSRNFGKEYALTAGIAHAAGAAIITLDGDGQHPVEVIPELIAAWRAGAQVVVGVRGDNSHASMLSRGLSKAFYKIFNNMTGQKLVPGSTDFRLIDRVVQQAFMRLTERDRITRGLIDWLGFERQYITFSAQSRTAGTASYSKRKLLRLAADSFVSLSPKPLYLFGYLGVLITALSFIVGLGIFTEQLILGDPLGWDFTGTAMLAIMLLFLVGIVLTAQGMMSLYITHIHSQSKQRPLYIVNERISYGIDETTLS